MLWKCLLVTAVLGVLAGQAVEGKRMLLRPIPASKVRQILKAADREDALPEGRVITHGLAALHGFTLGLKKGIIGVALVDSLAAMNWTDTSTNTTTATVSKPSFSYNDTSDQLCFTSRSTTSDIVASGEAEGRATSTSPTLPTTPTTATSPTTTQGTGTMTATTTSAGTGSVNCIVFQKG